MQDGRGYFVLPQKPEEASYKAPVRYQDSAYDLEGTRKLVEIMLGTGMAKRVMFNDRRIKGVLPMSGHDDHLHVEVNL